MDHNATVKRVIDGDTFECIVHLEFCLTLEITVRLLDVDTWEMKGPQKELGLAAKMFLKDKIENKKIILDPLKKDSFGRWLSLAYFDGENLSEMMQIYQKKIIKSLETKNLIV
jgi:endonuclease YncB( thermonuclease family)